MTDVNSLTPASLNIVYTFAATYFVQHVHMSSLLSTTSNSMEALYSYTKK